MHHRGLMPCLLLCDTDRQNGDFGTSCLRLCTFFFHFQYSNMSSKGAKTRVHTLVVAQYARIRRFTLLSMENKKRANTRKSRELRDKKGSGTSFDYRRCALGASACRCEPSPLTNIVFCPSGVCSRRATCDKTRRCEWGLI